MVFEWMPEYSVNVLEIDDQHKRFIGLLDRLYVAIQNQTINTQLREILDALIEYAHLHFDTEEKYFKEFNYPLEEEHKEEHKKLLNRVEAFNKLYVLKKADISFELVDFMEDWLVDHLKTQDHKYVKCFNEHGLF
jgi:hemerythrin